MSTDIPRIRQRELRDTALVQHGLVTTDDLGSLAMRSSTIRDWCRSDRLVRVAPRTYVVPELIDDWSQPAAACLSRPGAVASHRAAANLWGLDGIDVAIAEITASTGGRRDTDLLPRSADLANFEVAERAGIPCTDPTRTLIDLGAVATDTVVERALESALRLGLTRLRAREETTWTSSGWSTCRFLTPSVRVVSSRVLALLRWRLDELARPSGGWRAA